MKYLMLILVTAIALNISPAKSQSIRMIQADTIFKGYNSGVTSSVKFINHGTRLIYNHDGKLYEMDASDYKPLREIKLDETEAVTKFDVDENCKYIIYNTSSINKTLVADFNTGKMIKNLNGSYYLTKDNLFIYYGQGYVTDNVTYQFAKLRLYDLISLDSFNVKVKIFSGFEPKLRRVNSIYNTNTLIVATGGHLSGQSNIEYDPQWYVINFEADSMSYINFRVSNHFQYDINSLMFESKDGTYTAISQSFSITPDTKESQFLIFDSNYNYLYRILQSDLRKLTNDATLKLIFNAKIIDEKYIVFGIEQTINNVVAHSLMVYDLEAQYPRRIIDFDVNVFDYDSGKFIFSNKSGCLATLGLDRVPVQDNIKLSNEYLVSYSNNKLVVSTDETQEVSISIMNITGEEVESLNNIYLNEGSNTMQLNTELANGLYFSIIKEHENTILRKFMVIK